MTYQRLAWDDPSTTDEMCTDCAEVGRNLGVPMQRVPLPEVAPDGVPLTLQSGNAAFPVVTDRLAELAAGLQLHFD